MSMTWLSSSLKMMWRWSGVMKASSSPTRMHPLRPLAAESHRPEDPFGPVYDQQPAATAIGNEDVAGQRIAGGFGGAGDGGAGQKGQRGEGKERPRLRPLAACCFAAALRLWPHLGAFEHLSPCLETRRPPAGVDARFRPRELGHDRAVGIGELVAVVPIAHVIDLEQAAYTVDWARLEAMPGILAGDEDHC